MSSWWRGLALTARMFGIAALEDALPSQAGSHCRIGGLATRR